MKKVEVVASVQATKDILPKRKTEASNAHSTRMRDVADEETNRLDIIGTLLRGSTLQTRVLVTYNRQTNTYYMNYNSTVIPEEEVAFGTWVTLTDLGAVKLRNVRRFYEEKMPERVRELKAKLGAQPIPHESDLRAKGFEPLPTADIIAPRATADQDTFIEYDLDNVHLSAVTTVADIEVGTGDDFIEQHNYLERALEAAGFSFKAQLTKTDNVRSYNVTFQAQALNHLDQNDGEDINDVTVALELVVGNLGWQIDRDLWPLFDSRGGLIWRTAGNGIGISLDSKLSQLTFQRL